MAVKNTLVQRKQSPMAVYLQNDAVKNQINKIVGGKNSARFISSIVSAVQTTPALQECTNSSIVSAALLGEALNLSPSPQLGQFYMVPFNNKNSDLKNAVFVLGYKGLIQLATRSGYYRKINVLPIKEGELIRYDPLNEDIAVSLIEDEEVREQAKTIGYFAMFEYTNGFRKTLYWSKSKMLSHADRYSAAFSRRAYEDLEAGRIPEKDLWKYSSFWYKDFDSMACKTMLRQIISKWGIMSIDLQTAMEKDDSIIHEDGTVEYVENVEMEAAAQIPVDEHPSDNEAVAEAVENVNETVETVNEAPRQSPDVVDAIQKSFEEEFFS